MKQALQRKSAMPARRKAVAATLAALGVAWFAPVALAQDGTYPTRLVTLVVSAAAGGTTEVIPPPWGDGRPPAGSNNALTNR